MNLNSNQLSAASIRTDQVLYLGDFKIDLMKW